MPDSLYLTPEQIEALDDETLARYHTILRRADEEWSLFDKQQEAEDLSHRVDEILYGGAAGGGKTDWLLYHAYQLSQKFKNHRTLALRRTFPRLRETLMLRSKERFDPKVARWRAADKVWQFPATGSTITFGFCENEDDIGQYLSTEYDLIVIEEGTEFTGYQYLMLRSRNRTNARKRAQGIRPHTIVASNPGEVGHQFFKERFVLPTDYGKTQISRQILEVMERKKEVTVAFVQATAFDNPHIDPDYVFNLEQLPEVQKRQYLFGDWDVFSGMYFPEFQRTTHVIRPFDIPEGWARIRAVDYGFGNPYCCLWIAFDHDGNAYVYRERYGAGFTASAQGRQMADASKGETIIGTYADPAIWAREGSGLSIQTQYREAGVVCRKAMNKRIDGWSRVRDWMIGDGTVDGGSMLRIFDSCQNLVRTLPIMQFDKDRPEDLNTKLEDHAVDALRYGLATRAPRGRRRVQAQPSGDIDRNLLSAARGSRRAEHPVLGRA